MSNANSLAGVGINGTVRNTFPSQAVSLAATETILTVNTDTGTVPYFLTVPVGGQVYGANTGLDVNANTSITDRSVYMYGLPSGESNDQFNTNSWNARAFKVRVSGTGNVGAVASQSLVFNLRRGTSTTPGSDTLIATTGTALPAVAGGPFNFLIEATLLWDPTSGTLSGSYTSNIAYAATAQYTPPVTIPTIQTGITAPNLSFLATVTLGAAAASTVTVQEFILDRV